MPADYVQERTDRSSLLQSPGADNHVAGNASAEFAQKTVLVDRRPLGDFAHLSSEWFWEMDANLIFNYLSAQFTDTTGISTSLVLEISDARLGILDENEWLNYRKQLGEQRSFRALTFSCLHPDGRDVVISMDGDAFFNDAGKFLGYRGVGRELANPHLLDTATQQHHVLYQLAGNIPNVGFWERDEIADKCISCTTELANIFGVSVPQFLQLMAADAGERAWIHAEDRAGYTAAIGRFRSGHKSFEFEYRLLRADGRVTDVCEVFAPIVDRRGVLIRSIGFIKDISAGKEIASRLQQSRDDLERRVQERTIELQQANDELQESRSQLCAAARVARLGYFHRDSVHGRGISCNDELAEIFGVPVTECRTETDSEYMSRVHPEDVEMVSAARLNSYADNTPVDMEYRVIRPDGDIRHVHELSTPRTDNEGTVIQTFGTLQDTTDRKVIKNELAMVEERLHELGANAREVLYVLSADWRQLIYVSAAFEEIWGISRDVVLADPRIWQSSIHPDDRDMIDAEIARKISGEDPTPDFSDCRIVGADGKIRWLFARVYPIRDNSGEIVRYAGVAEDITERKAAVEALHQSQKMDAVGKLTGGVAHDFNNLLAVIMGNSSLLQARVSEADEALLQDIIDAGKRGAELTRRLLAFSRLQPLQPVETNVVALVRDMGELLRRTLGATIRVDIVSASDAVRAVVDPALLQNAILNLSLNARDAMSDGGRLEICVGCATPDELPTSNSSERTARNYLAIAVKDDGVGMEPDVLSRALDPFFTTKNDSEGSGLGLSMVYGFAKQSNGDLSIASTSGAGTVVTLYLPGSEE